MGNTFKSPLPPLGERSVVSASYLVNPAKEYFVAANATAAGFTLSIPTASPAYQNVALWLQKTDDTFNPVNIAGGGSLRLATVDERVLYQCNGATWAVIDRIFPSRTVLYGGSAVIGGLGTPSLVGTNFLVYRRVFEYCELRGKIGTGTVGASLLFVNIPPGLTANHAGVDQLLMGNATSSYGGAVQAGIVPIILSSSLGLIQFGLNNTRNGLTPLNGNDLNANSGTFYFNVLVRILGWDG